MLRVNLKYIALCITLAVPYVLAFLFWRELRSVKQWQETASQVINNNAGVQNQIVEFLNRVAQPPQ